MPPAKVRTATALLWACFGLGILAVAALTFVPDLSDDGRPPVLHLLAGCGSVAVCGVAAYGLDHRRWWGFPTAYAVVPYAVLVAAMTQGWNGLALAFWVWLSWLLLHRSSRAYARTLSRAFAAGCR